MCMKYALVCVNSFETAECHITHLGIVGYWCFVFEKLYDYDILEICDIDGLKIVS